MRSLALPGYIQFTREVARTVLSNRWLFIKLVGLYSILLIVFVGLSSQNSYEELASLISDTGSNVFQGVWGQVGQAGLLLVAGVSSSVNPDLTEVQRYYSAILGLMTWLTAVWLLRAILVGKKPKLRDGLYNAGAPILASVAVLGILVLQLIPAALALIAINSAIQSGFFDNGFIAMTGTLFVGLLVLASLYWVTSTVIALVIVTLPGMYPWKAIQTAGDIVIGRRLRIVLRLSWLLVLNLLVLFTVMLIVVLLQQGLVTLFPSLSSVPIVPVAFVVMGASIIVWSATYIYILYRKIVEDDADPA